VSYLGPFGPGSQISSLSPSLYGLGEYAKSLVGGERVLVTSTGETGLLSRKEDSFQRSVPKEFPKEGESEIPSEGEHWGILIGWVPGGRVGTERDEENRA